MRAPLPWGRWMPWHTEGLRGTYLRHEAIAQLLPRNRAQQLLRYLCVYDRDKKPPLNNPDGTPNPNYDRFFKTKRVHDSVSVNLAEEYTPEASCTIDESCAERMEGKDGEGAAKCYNKDKPIQRHNKMYVLNEAGSGITLAMESHRSRVNQTPPGPHGKMYDICQRLVNAGLLKDPITGDFMVSLGLYFLSLSLVHACT